MVISVRLTNIRKHKDTFLKIDGKNVALIGDSGVCKSTVLEIIEASFGIIDYPKDALTTGESEGGSVMEYKDPVTDKIYVIQRRYSRGKLQRFEIRSEENGKLVWTEEIKKLFNGVDPKVSFFDYSEFFFEQKTPDARFEYAMKCVLGDVYINNLKDIQALENERHSLGAQRKILISRLKDTIITPDNYKELIVKYKAPLPNDEAVQRRNEILDKRPKVHEILKELELVKKKNEEWHFAHANNHENEYLVQPTLINKLRELTTIREALKDFFSFHDSVTTDITPYEDIPTELNPNRIKYENISELSARILNEFDSFIGSLKMLDTSIKELNQQLKEAKKANEGYKNFLDNNQLEEEKEKKLQQEFDTAADTTLLLEKQAQEVYDSKMLEIDRFNAERLVYLQQKEEYDQLQKCNEEWIQKDNGIKDIELDNRLKFKEKIPFPDLEIKDIEIEKTGAKKGEIVIKQHLYYKGRELNFENVSKGESLQIAFQFQTAYNPRFKMVFLPEALNLGSKFDDLVEAAATNGYQWIAEFTERGEEFKMKFEEELFLPGTKSTEKKVSPTVSKKKK
jgi:hypothetical protein